MGKIAKSIFIYFAITLCIGIGGTTLFSLSSDSSYSSKNNETNYGDKLSLKKPLTFLLASADSNSSSVDSLSYTTTDYIVLGTFNPQTLKVTTSIVPSNLRVNYTCNESSGPINMAFQLGKANCLVKTIENYFDLTVDYFAVVNINILDDIIKSVGSVPVSVPQEICYDDETVKFNYYIDENCFSKGNTVMDGQTLQAYIKSILSLEDMEEKVSLGKGLLKDGATHVKSISKLKLLQLGTTLLSSSKLNTNITVTDITKFASFGLEILKSKDLLLGDSTDNYQQLPLSFYEELLKYNNYEYDEINKDVIATFFKTSNLSPKDLLKYSVDLALFEEAGKVGLFTPNSMELEEITKIHLENLKVNGEEVKDDIEEENNEEDNINEPQSLIDKSNII